LATKGAEEEIGRQESGVGSRESGDRIGLNKEETEAAEPEGGSHTKNTKSTKKILNHEIHESLEWGAARERRK
jgi:hypothetical protein